MNSDAIMELFTDLLNAEKAVLDTYTKIIEEIKNEKIKSVISGIVNDEQKHIMNANKMLNILQ
ncbi:hypothetical protein GOV04_02855 [Candidatus Woesearchaeota archaeon]|nr:hypothetical protein [Candidatus Woesearchaeota archaeon]